MQLVPFDFLRDNERWDRFVLDHPAGSFFHLSSWHQIIKASYKSFEPSYQLLEDHGRLLAILPMTRVRRPLAGTGLISNPFAVSAGPLYVEGLDPSAMLEMVARQAQSVDYLEMRDASFALPDTWQTSQYFVNFEKTLLPDHEKNWLAIPNRQRAVIRKADKLTINHHDDLERFLEVYSVSLRNLGTPIYPRQYFEKLLEFFAESICLVNVSHRGKDLTTVLCFKHKNRLMPYYGGGLLEARDHHAYPWMYWQLMQYGVDHAMPVFDFGRSPAKSGPYAFKKNLGFEARPLNYAYLPINGPVPDLTGNSRTARTLIAIWQKLPVGITKLLGPLGAIYAV